MEARPGRRLAFHNASPAVNWWLAMRGERFRWGIERDDLESFLANKGWNLLDMASSEKLRRRILAPRGRGDVPLAIGESVALAYR
jgi:hypothetical protein